MKTHKEYWNHQISKEEREKMNRYKGFSYLMMEFMRRYTKEEMTTSRLRELTELAMIDFDKERFTKNEVAIEEKQVLEILAQGFKWKGRVKIGFFDNFYRKPKSSELSSLKKSSAPQFYEGQHVDIYEINSGLEGDYFVTHHTELIRARLCKSQLLQYIYKIENWNE